MDDEPLSVMELQAPDGEDGPPPLCDARCVLVTSRVYSAVTLLALIGAAASLISRYPEVYVGYYITGIAGLLTVVESRLILNMFFLYCYDRYQSTIGCCSILKTKLLKRLSESKENTHRFFTAHDKTTKDKKSVWNDLKLFCRPCCWKIRPVFKYLFKFFFSILKLTYDVCKAILCFAISLIYQPIRILWCLIINIGDLTSFILYSIIAMSMCMVENKFWLSIVCGCLLEVVALLNLLSFYNKLTRPSSQTNETHIVTMVEKKVWVRDLDRIHQDKKKKKTKTKITPQCDMKKENTAKVENIQPNNETVNRDLFNEKVEKEEIEIIVKIKDKKEENSAPTDSDSRSKNTSKLTKDTTK